MNLIGSRIVLLTLARVVFVALAFGGASAGAVVVRTSVAYRPAAVYRPVTRTAVVAGAPVGAAVAVGTVVRSLPPSCTARVVGNVAYQQCGGAWYRPAYAGTTVSYTVVAPPR
jgi:hypothetical protein